MNFANVLEWVFVSDGLVQYQATPAGFYSRCFFGGHTTGLDCQLSRTESTHNDDSDSVFGGFYPADMGTWVWQAVQVAVK